MTYDLTVIGGGPAGCSAAITAARAGCSVLLLERGHYPRHRVCGEFVSAESLALLSDLLLQDGREILERAPGISESRVFVDNAVLRLPIDPPAASLTRFELDSLLWSSCLAAKVDALQDSSVSSVEGDGPFTVRVNAETFKSRAVINAAGRWSLLTRAENRTRAAAERWIGVKAHFHEAKPSSTVDLYFFPGGYCGVQPVALPQGDSGDAIVNACAMVRAEVATSLNEVLKLHPALRERAQTWRPAIDQVSTSPLIFHKPEPLNRTILQAGDAATFVDPFIGDGISLALRSGVLAARCLQACLRGSASLAQSAHQYEQLYAERLAPVFWASSLLRSLLRMPKILRCPAMSVLQHTPAVTRQIVRMTR